MKTHPLYEIVQEILAQGLEKCSRMKEFEEQYVTLLPGLLPPSYSPEEIRLARESVRASIIDFFHLHGMSVFIFFEKDDRLRIFKKVKEVHKSPYVTFLTRWLLEHKEEFKESIREQKFSQEEIAQISEEADNLIDFKDEFLRRDVIRQAIKKGFGFDVRDAIFLFDNEAHIKNFDYNFVRLNNELRELGKRSSIEPISESEESQIASSLEGVNLGFLLGDITTEVLRYHTPIGGVNNIDFARRFLFFIRQKLRLALEEFWKRPLSNQLKNLFCEHLIRENLDLIYQSVVSELLAKLITKDKEAKKFIDFYNGKVTFLAPSKRVKKPLIKDEKERIHQSESIYQLVQNRRYIATEVETLQTRILDLGKSKEEMEEQIKLLEDKLIVRKEEKRHIEGELERVSIEIKKLKMQSKSQPESLKKLVDSESLWLAKNRTLTSSLEELNENLDHLRKERRKIPETIRMLEKQITHKIEASRALFEEYEMMKRALAQAIASFKVDD
ncbi:hypothetical protein [Wolinella succinogenes]|uniref:hypothetical protein n=1 Tax=Wolinella succinogenes TaxID=844 RepID=UPI00169E9107|nr:hypothetical protein [Wolinella succinogenes]NLU34299.1 hypothetical protein [Wolinella succinogenes]